MSNLNHSAHPQDQSIDRPLRSNEHTFRFFRSHDNELVTEPSVDVNPTDVEIPRNFRQSDSININISENESDDEEVISEIMNMSMQMGDSVGASLGECSEILESLHGTEIEENSEKIKEKVASMQTILEK